MKKINQINCHVCAFNHVVEIYKNNDNSLTFKALKQPFSIWQILGHIKLLITNYNSFLNSSRRNFLGLVIKKEEITRFIKKLEENGYIEKIPTEIEKLITYNIKATKKTPEYKEIVYEYYDKYGIRLSYNEELKETNLSIRLLPKKGLFNILLYSSGYMKNILPSEEINIFIYWLKQALKRER